MKKIFYISLILTFFLTSNVRAGEQSSVLLSGKVHYSIPSDWKIIDRKTDISSDKNLAEHSFRKNRECT